LVCPAFFFVTVFFAYRFDGCGNLLPLFLVFGSVWNECGFGFCEKVELSFARFIEVGSEGQPEGETG
jgi:hypothetical protein